MILTQRGACTKRLESGDVCDCLEFAPTEWGALCDYCEHHGSVHQPPSVHLTVCFINKCSMHQTILRLLATLHQVCQLQHPLSMFNVSRVCPLVLMMAVFSPLMLCKSKIVFLHHTIMVGRLMPLSRAIQSTTLFKHY